MIKLNFTLKPSPVKYSIIYRTLSIQTEQDISLNVSDNNKRQFPVLNILPYNTTKKEQKTYFKHDVSLNKFDVVVNYNYL